VQDCIDGCDSRGYPYSRLVFCDKSCLGNCFMKCDLNPAAIADELAGAGTGWANICKNDCYQPCGCTDGYLG
jgi:hypothetical protein